MNARREPAYVEAVASICQSLSDKFAEAATSVDKKRSSAEHREYVEECGASFTNKDFKTWGAEALEILKFDRDQLRIWALTILPWAAGRAGLYPEEREWFERWIGWRDASGSLKPSSVAAMRRLSLIHI